MHGSIKILMKGAVCFLLLYCIAVYAPCVPACADDRIALSRGRAELESMWRSRIQSFLDGGIIPLVDLESSLRREDGEKYLKKALKAMDSEGIALIAFDGYQAEKTKNSPTGYRWGYYIHEVVNAHPDRFVLATNGGTNKNWIEQRSSFIEETERQVRSGDYPIMGEYEFRHYMSSAQCRKGRTDRDMYVPMTCENGHRLFRLSQETGIPFLIHLEPEDTPLAELEQMLARYPKARVIWCHLGQIRHPGREALYGPGLLRRLLAAYPNLYIDISTGHPGRRYQCNNNVLDTVIWQDGYNGSQKDRLRDDYRAILTDFCDRFVVGFDYGGGRPPLDLYIREKAKTRRLIMRDLPEEAQHAIGYRNAWFLLTGKQW